MLSNKGNPQGGIDSDFVFNVTGRKLVCRGFLFGLVYLRKLIPGKKNKPNNKTKLNQTNKKNNQS